MSHVWLYMNIRSLQTELKNVWPIFHITLRLLKSVVFSFATSAQHDQPAHSFILNMISFAGYSESNFLITIPINDKWYCPHYLNA